MNYLPKLFNYHLNYIKNIVSRRKISLIINESPDILGRKTVNTLISFYNERKKEKTVLLIDCAVSDLINAGKIKNISENALMKTDKKWNDVITISTYSASYMKKFCNLVHMSVHYGFKINDMVNIRNLIIKFGNLSLN